MNASAPVGTTPATTPVKLPVSPVPGPVGRIESISVAPPKPAPDTDIVIITNPLGGINLDTSDLDARMKAASDRLNAAMKMHILPKLNPVPPTAPVKPATPPVTPPVRR